MRSAARARVRVSELTELLAVSEMTIRRDLDALAAAGLLEKVHGGATMRGGLSAEEPGFEAKSHRQLKEKEAIARAAARLVEPGQSIGLTAGTTTWRLAHHLAHVPDLTVVTNSIQVANVLHREPRPDLTVVLTGGVRTPSDALVGPIALTAIRSLHLDVPVMGVHGVSGDAGLTTPNLLEAETDRALVAASARLVVVADHTKWGVRGLSRIAGLDDVDVFVSDQGLDRAARATIGEHVERLLIASSPRATSRPRSRVSISIRGDLRTDELTGVQTFVVDSRQDRPNLPDAGCPFCPGGLEAPEDYDVRWFRNRWPAMPDERCEVVLYTPQHDATFWSLGLAGARKVDRPLGGAKRRRSARAPTSTTSSSSRTAAQRSAPRSRIRTDRSTRSTSCPSSRTASSAAARSSASRATGSSPNRPAGAPGSPRRRSSRTPSRLVPDDPVPDLPSLGDAGRDGLAALLVDVLERFDRLFDAETPYMLWIHQRPFDGGDWPDARLHVEIVTPWRAPGVPRYVAAGELGSGVYFNPVAPEAAAQSLRDAL